MPPRKFAIANLIGAVLWTVGIAMLGYVVGVWFEHVLSQIPL